MKLFPIGTLSGGSGSGTISGRTYNFFEPNAGCQSSPNYTSLVGRFQNMTILARKKASPYLTLIYKYNNILSTEFRQIEDFINDVDEAVESFYLVDLSKGIIPTAINTSSTWTASIDNTRLYDSVSNQKSNYIFFYNSIRWKIGTVLSITANTSVVCDVDTYNYGTLTDTEGGVVTGNLRTIIYPVYQVFANPGTINALQVSGYWPSSNTYRGPIYSGDISFVSKYKI